MLSWLLYRKETVKSLWVRLSDSKPNASTLLLDIQHRVFSKADEAKNPEHAWLNGFNAGILSRWELCYYKLNWPSSSADTHQSFQEAIDFLDGFLKDACGHIETNWPEVLKSFILPEGIPVHQVKEALGPVQSRVCVVAALGRHKPLPRLPLPQPSLQSHKKNHKIDDEQEDNSNLQ